MTAPAPERSRIPRLAEDYSQAAATERMEFVHQVTGTSAEHIGRYSLDPAALAGNIENFVGAAQVPLGLAGPLLVVDLGVPRNVDPAGSSMCRWRRPRERWSRATTGA